MRRLALACVLLVAVACSSGGKPGLGNRIQFPAKKAPDSTETITLEGAVWGTGKTAVIFAHSYPTTQDAWASYARTIATRGFLAITFNFRGYGLSQGDKDPSRADLDLEGAIEKAKSLGAVRILLVGASMGGTAALVVGARQTVAGVVAVSAPVEFQGLDALRSARALKEPVLFIAAEQDPAGAADAARTLAKDAPEPKELDILKGASAHGTDLLEGDTGDRVATDIAQFLEDHRR